MLHRRTHPENVEGCYACHLASVQYSPQALPVKSPEHREKNPPKAFVPNNSWERGIPADRRGMPFLQGATVTPHSSKSFADNRRRIEEGRRANHGSV